MLRIGKIKESYDKAKEKYLKGQPLTEYEIHLLTTARKYFPDHDFEFDITKAKKLNEE
jgi:hypothetical protein